MLEAQATGRDEDRSGSLNRPCVLSCRHMPEPIDIPKYAQAAVDALVSIKDALVVQEQAFQQLGAQFQAMRQQHPDWFDDEGYLKDA